MADSTVKVIFLGDAKDLRRALDDVDDASGKVSGSFGRIKDTALGVFAGGALLGGVQKLASGLMDASKAAREDEQAQAQLKQALQNTVNATDAQVASVEKWISKTQNATGVLDDELRPALGTLVRATGDVGEAQELMTLAMDISQATGKDLGAVSLALAKAHEGNVGGLQRLGISMRGANGETMAFADAQVELAALFGGAVATNLTTVQGRTQLLQARMADLQEEVGTRVNVAILAFADFMQQRVVPAIEVVVAWVQEHWPEIRDTIETVMVRVREVIETVLGAIQAFWRTWGDEVMLVVTTLFNFIRTFIETTLLVIQGIVNVVMGLIHGDFSRVWEGIKQIFQAALDWIRGLVDLAMGLIEAAISAGMTAIAGIFDGIWAAIVNMFQSAWWKMENIARSVLEGIKHIVSSALNFVRDIIDNGMRMVQSTFQLAWWAMEAAVQNSIGTVLRLVGDLPGQILGWLGDLGGLLWDAGVRLIQGFIGGIGSMFGAVRDKLGDLTGALTGWKGPPARDKKLLYGAGQMIIGGLVEGMKAEEGSVQGYLSGLTGDIPDFGGMRGVRGAVNVLTTPAGGGGQSIVVNINYPVRDQAAASQVGFTVARELAVALRGSVN